LPAEGAFRELQNGRFTRISGEKRISCGFSLIVVNVVDFLEFFQNFPLFLNFSLDLYRPF